LKTNRFGIACFSGKMLCVILPALCAGMMVLVSTNLALANKKVSIEDQIKAYFLGANWFTDEHKQWEANRFNFEYADMNGDSIPEIIASLDYLGLNHDRFVFQSHPFRMILGDSSAEGISGVFSSSIEVLETRSNGWHDINAWVHSGYENDYISIFRWNGVRYEQFGTTERSP